VNWKPFLIYDNDKNIILVNSNKMWNKLRFTLWQVHSYRKLKNSMAEEDFLFYPLFELHRGTGKLITEFFLENNMLEQPTIDFPCKDCLVLSCCSELCDKTNYNLNNLNHLLYPLAIEIQCPDCSTMLNTGLEEVRVKCSECGHLKEELQIMDQPVKCNNCNHEFYIDFFDDKQLILTR